MKKTYFAPETVVVAVSTATIMAGSLKADYTEETQSNEEALSRRKSYSVWDDEDEE